MKRQSTNDYSAMMFEKSAELNCTTCRKRHCRFLLLFAALAFSCGLSQAEITFDGSLGPKATMTGPRYFIAPKLGQQKGDNLFYSFGRLNIGSGEVATFTGPATTTNIVSRVTGGASSWIDGVIDTRKMPGANFFLLNPNGVMFGSNAKIEVGGSFHVSTADYITFPGENVRFLASLSGPSMLSISDPVAFGFLGTNAGLISISSQGLTASPQKTLSFVGGDVRITGATLVARGGKINLAGLGAIEALVPINSTAAGADRLRSQAALWM